MPGASQGVIVGVGRGHARYQTNPPVRRRRPSPHTSFFYERCDHRIDDLCCPNCNCRIIARVEGIKCESHRSITAKNVENSHQVSWIKKYLKESSK